MKTVYQIKEWIKQNTQFEADDENAEEEVLFTCRDHGNVGEEEFGEEDYEEAQQIEVFITENFPLCTSEIETVDEWVHITININL